MRSDSRHAIDTASSRRLGGEIAVERRPPTGKSVSVSCSCRACVRACGRGEAAREPPDCKPEVGPKVRFPSGGGRVDLLLVDDLHRGFLDVAGKCAWRCPAGVPEVARRWPVGVPPVVVNHC